MTDEQYFIFLFVIFPLACIGAVKVLFIIGRYFIDTIKEEILKEIKK